MLYINEAEFSWNDSKASQNLIKHGVSFIEATTVWYDAESLEIPDPEHSLSEERWIRLGFSQRFRILIVVYCEYKNGVIRIISSRKATTNEKSQYYERRI